MCDVDEKLWSTTEDRADQYCFISISVAILYMYVIHILVLCCITGITLVIHAAKRCHSFYYNEIFFVYAQL